MHGVGDPDAGAFELAGETRWGDADDGEGLVIQAEQGAKDLGIGIEAGAPELFADDDDGGGIGGGAFVLTKEAAEARLLEAVEGEKIAAGEHEQPAGGIVLAKGGIADAPSGKVAEGAGIGPVGAVIGDGDADLGEGAAAGGLLGGEVGEGAGRLVHAGTHEHAVEDGEDAGIDADAEGEGEDGGGGKEGTAAQEAEAVADVLEQGFKPVPGAAFAKFLADHGGVAEGLRGGAAGGLGRHAAGEVVAEFHFEVLTDFVVVVAAHRISSSGVACRTPVTARTTCSHLPVSAMSFLRPARVSL